MNIGAFLLQDELDSFIHDTRHQDITHLLTLIQGIKYMYEIYYDYEDEIDFPRQHSDCELGQEEEDLETTLPYISPSELYDQQQQQQLGVRSLDVHTNTQDMQPVPIPQYDGTNDYDDDEYDEEFYYSPFTSPSQWTDFRFHSQDSQAAHWDHTGEHLDNSTSNRTHTAQVHSDIRPTYNQSEITNPQETQADQAALAEETETNLIRTQPPTTNIHHCDIYFNPSAIEVVDTVTEIPDEDNTEIKIRPYFSPSHSTDMANHPHVSTWTPSQETCHNEDRPFDDFFTRRYR